MKTKHLVLAGLLLMGLQTAVAQNYFSDYRSHSEANLERVAKQYLAALDSDNEGIAESALAHIARMKMYFPEMNFDRLASRVMEISASGPTPRIRYQAYLVSSLFGSPATFSGDSRLEYESPEALFTAIAERMHSTLLGAHVSVSE